jgi:hypothetical protein
VEWARALTGTGKEQKVLFLVTFATLQKSDYYLRRLSVPWEKFCFYYKNFHEILYLRTYWTNLSRKFQFTLKLCTFMMVPRLIL